MRDLASFRPRSTCIPNDAVHRDIEDVRIVAVDPPSHDDGRTTFYDAIENWWGEPFDDSLINRMVEAPDYHWRAFVEYLKSPGAFTTAKCSELTSRILRPVLCPSFDRRFENRWLIALRVLAYAH